jgi:hypothetical protein
MIESVRLMELLAIPANTWKICRATIDREKIERYLKLSTPAPPIILAAHTNEILDGCHRIIVAINQGAATIQFVRQDPATGYPR